MSANQTASLPVNSISQALGFADHGFPSGKPNFETVKPNANGRWKEILSALGVDPATLKNQHGPCPGCGGKDRFRFDNLYGDGTFICSQGGLGEKAGDGFELLVHAGKASSATEALRFVADYLGRSEVPTKANPTRTTICTPAMVRTGRNAMRSAGIDARSGALGKRLILCACLQLCGF